MKPTFREKIDAGQVVLGLANSYPASGIIEGMAAGWDFVWIDAQHGQFTLREALGAHQAAEAMGLGTLLRVPGHEPGVIGPLIDLAPDAIMVPVVNSAAEAAAIVQAVRFAPEGARSYGGRRAIDRYGRDYFRTYRPLLLAQIESRQAVAHAAEIAATPGVDGLFFGPDDMKVQLGIGINTPVLDDPRLTEALEATARTARAAGKRCGTVAAAPALAQRCAALGCTILACGADVGFMRVAAAKALADMQAALRDG